VRIAWPDNRHQETGAFGSPTGLRIQGEELVDRDGRLVPKVSLRDLLCPPFPHKLPLSIIENAASAPARSEKNGREE
jgi:hypothetical protein